VWCVGEELVEVVTGGVVEREAGGASELRVEILESLAPEFGLALENAPSFVPART
jgi:hypothetical protein